MKREQSHMTMTAVTSSLSLCFYGWLLPHLGCLAVNEERGGSARGFGVGRDALVKQRLRRAQPRLGELGKRGLRHEASRAAHGRNGASEYRAACPSPCAPRRALVVAPNASASSGSR